jgi:PIN domain nuclease of toxin-antitoxin system
LQQSVFPGYSPGSRWGTPRSRIEAEATVVSAASIWEIAIKTALGKLDAPRDLPARIEQLGFELLPVVAEHAWQVRFLPRHHSDPFDRLLIANPRSRGWAS